MSETQDIELPEELWKLLRFFYNMGRNDQATEMGLDWPVAQLDVYEDDAGNVKVLAERAAPIAKVQAMLSSGDSHLEMMAATIAAGMCITGLNGHKSPARSSIPGKAVDLARAIQEEVRKDG